MKKLNKLKLAKDYADEAAENDDDEEDTMVKKDNGDVTSVCIVNPNNTIGAFDIPPDLWEDIQKILKRDRCEIRDYVYSALLMYTEAFKTHSNAKAKRG